MEIPFFNYAGLYRENAQRYDQAIKSVMERGAFIMQSDLYEFEEKLANFLKCKHVIGVADGTAALELSLIVSGVQPGDEVIVSSHTFVATAAAVKHVGGIPVVADCKVDSTIDPESVMRLLSHKTKFIMPTQLNGRVSDMDAICSIANEYELGIVEDSCQALGAKFRSKFAGLFGLAGSYSFYPAKTLGCFGDGGAIATNSASVATDLRMLRDHGRSDSGEVIRFGRNGRLDNIQAAILRIKLETYQAAIDRRRALAKIYCEELSDLDAIVLPPAPNSDARYFDIYQNFEIQANNRGELREYLASNGVGTIMQWGGWMLHQFDKLNLKHDAKFAEDMSKRFLLLPMHHLLSDDEVYYICQKIKKFYNHY